MGWSKKLHATTSLTVKELVKAARSPTTYSRRLERYTLEQLISWLVPGTSVEEIQSLRQELIANENFYNALNRKYVSIRRRRLGGGPFEGGAQRELIYVLIRLLQPENFVETGVFDGLSSAYILEAMRENGKGHLSSIDLPAHTVFKHSTNDKEMGTIPPGTDPGWVIPDYLRERHTLHLGDAKKLLEPMLKKLGNIDVFLHDSMHTYEHMHWEYSVVYPYIVKNGLLLSDDIFGWAATGVFFKFCRQMKIEGRPMGNLGAAKKT